MDVLLPTDFSELAQAALEPAIELAKVRGGTLHLLHVVAPLHLPFPEGEFVVGDREAEARRLLEEIATRIGDRARTEIHVVSNLPDVGIVRTAQEHGIGCIVIAPHGHGGLQRFMLGSTAERVIRDAPCPVLLVRTAGDPCRILAAVDLTEEAAVVLEAAGRIARERGGSLTIAHVVGATDLPTRLALMPQAFPNAMQEIRRRLLRELETLADRHAGELEPRVVLCDGVPSAAIADLAREEGSGLIVTGVGSASAPHRGLGSTAERIARGAPCSVMTVR